MTLAVSRAVAITAELTRVMQADRGRLLSALTAQLRNLPLAEDVLQEAALSALTHWGRLAPARLAHTRLAARSLAKGHGRPDRSGPHPVGPLCHCRMVWRSLTPPRRFAASLTRDQTLGPKKRPSLRSAKSNREV